MIPRWLLLLLCVAAAAATAAGLSACAGPDMTPPARVTLNVPAGMSEAEFDQTERARLAAQRAAAQQAHEQQRRACYQKFAVNHCLAQAREQLRHTLGGLRQYEIALNDRTRQRAAQQQIERTREMQARQASRLPDAAAAAETADAAASAGLQKH